MWIVTNKMIFSLYPEDTVELEKDVIKILRNGSPEEFIMKFGSDDAARSGWKKLQDAVKKGFQNVSIYECEPSKKELASKKGRIF